MRLDATELARDWTARRVAVPLAGSSAVLARDPAFPAAARMNALFVSRTTSANALAALRGQVEGVLAGGTTPERAAQVLRAAFGSDAGAAGLVSPGRAKEIVRMQAMQAYAVGERAVATHPAVMEAFPYWRYEATQDGRTRPTHARLDGLVLRKDDPFWRTHTPPWEFGCRCALSPVSEDEAQSLGVAQARTRDGADGSQSATVVTARGETVNLPGNESGYVFDVDGAFRESDMGHVKELKDRRRILDDMIAAARESETNWRFFARNGGADELLPPPPGVENAVRGMLEELRPAILEKLASGEKYVQDGPGISLSLGPVPASAAEGLGLRQAETEMRLSSPGSKHKGTKHWSRDHAAVMADPVMALDLLRRSVWNAGSRWWIDVKAGKRVYLSAGNLAQDAMTVFLRDGDTWRLEMLSTFRPDNSGGSYMDRLQGKRREN